MVSSELPASAFWPLLDMAELDNGTRPPEVGAVEIPFLRVLAASAIIVAESAAMRFLEIGIADQLLISGIRCFVQLNLLGYILYPIFSTNQPAIVGAYIFGFMILVSSYEAAARPKVTSPYMFRNVVISLGSSLLIMGFFLLLIVTPTPWYNAQYLVPLAGMLINNALTGLAPALNMMLDHLKTKKEHIEVLLSFGATPMEAAWPGFTATFRQALIPTINGMNVVGLVSIPGMMTGQVLGGSSPTKAAKYQIIIFFMISGMTGLAVFSLCMLTIRSLFDTRGRLASHLITAQTRRGVAQILNPSSWCSRRKPASADSSKHAPLLDAAVVAPSGLELRCTTDMEFSMSRKVVLRLDVQGTIAASRPVRALLPLHEHEIICVMGPSGVGKSTLLKLISDLQAPSPASSMTLQGQPYETVCAQAWRRDVLYVHQSKAPLPGTPKELVQLIQKMKVNRGRQLLDPVPVMEAFGLDSSFLERPWSELSGGEAQRIMCAIAISTRPACILLDEPTSALDEASKALVENTLRAMDCSILVVTHDERQAERLGSRIWRLQEA